YNTYAGFPTGNLSNITRCTDPRSAVDGESGAFFTSFVGGGGGSGGKIYSNTNSTLLTVETAPGGAHYITGLSGGKCVAPSGISGGNQAAGVIFITQDLNDVSPGSSSSTTDFGSGGWSKSVANKWWFSGGSVNIPNSNSATQAFPITVNTATGHFTYANAGGIPTPYIDWKYGLPVGNT